MQAEESAGAAAGIFDLPAVLQSAHRAGARATEAAGFRCGLEPPTAETSEPNYAIAPCWSVAGRGKAFVDFQNDVTVDDIALAHRENFVSVEHLKRYTTLGMGTDQGKTSNVNALAIMAALTGQTPEAAGTTTFRFPFTPVALGAFAGRNRGALFQPVRQMPAHDWHVAHGAVFEEYAGWRRPSHYVRGNETEIDAVRREALAVRERVGLFEASPLGKIEVKGPDAAKFLDRIYTNAMSSLKVGRARYGLMLNEQGVVIDDGVTARLADDRFLVGTTSGGAGRIAAWLDEWRQCEWPDLAIVIAPVTANWGTLALAGPAAREVLAAAGTDFPLGAPDFPHMSVRARPCRGHRRARPARELHRRAVFRDQCARRAHHGAMGTADGAG